MLSNLSIEGSDYDAIYTTEATLRAPGSLEKFTNDQFLDAVASRSGCQVTNAKGEAVYGDLRLNEESNQYECISDHALLDSPLITGEYANVKVSSGSYRSQHLFGRGIAGFAVINVSQLICQRATMRCADGGGDAFACTGLFKGVDANANNTYLCDDNIKVTKSDSPYAPEQTIGCLEVRNLDMKDTGWMYALKFTFPPPYIIDEINAMYTASTARKTVKDTRRKSITHISPMWFLVMALKVFIAVALLIGSCFLWSKGHQPVAHDENALAELISAGIQHDPNDADDLSLGAISVNDNTKSWKSTSNMSTSSDIFLNADSGANGTVVYAQGYNASQWPNNPNERLDEMERQHW